ncbi:g10535 [Coccomyxa elongata]
MFDVHPGIIFLLTFNRDEFFDRPTKEAHFWEDAPDILAGRDLKGGGTWLGVSKSGRFALLTNFREPGFRAVKGSPSRGALTVDFLKGQQSPLEFLQSLDVQAYNGVNLIVGDLKSKKVAYTTNRGRDGAGKQLQELFPGIYGLSNGVLGDKWVKVERGQDKLRSLAGAGGFAEGRIPWEAIMTDIMGDRRRVEDEAQLPPTGMPAEIERAFSSIFVEPFAMPGGSYGTRSQTVMAVWQDGRVELRERFRGATDEWSEVQHAFSIEGMDSKGDTCPTEQA